MNSERRLSFGGVAGLYDRRRPSYPAALIDDVIALTGAAPSLRALEVGAGTGKATVLFAARGVAVDALEPSAEMAAIARVNTAAYPDVTVAETEFEGWRRGSEPYRLLYSAQAWHWIAPDQRYTLARAALADGGVLAAFWNRVAWERCALREPLEEAYARHAAELTAANNPMRPGSERRTDPYVRWNAEIDAAAGFGDAELRSYEWQTSYAAAAYTELLETHSDHIVLAPARRAALLEAVRAAVDAAGGVLELPYVTRLCLARAR